MEPKSQLDGSRRDAIVQAALEVLAARGSADSSLQIIAKAAGVSVGLIQHYFGSKDGLIEAVDSYALRIIGTAMAEPTPPSATESIPEVGRRVTALFGDHLPVLDYVARQVVEGTAAGKAFFDAVASLGIQRWDDLSRGGATIDDLDTVWAGLNPLILTLGAITFRRHVDRYLPEAFTSPGQLSRWEQAVNTLIGGQLNR
ncbi:TetR family transcriptional regulator [Mycolicibacterium sphagni]|uniref:TetR family transcriptional regulator n=1 Tax=Mycolicibacterium sphagni TaxID=1786 RepID=A0A255DBS3_9MYCO|nr:TetR/AcrR family transcriptional regulator [Mycolicibacterium sphagni]MCV7178098.1 TetR family transcriptional regulator [Mycolicibacterium sphagni]OYN76550.1 TetR family transcriptional regulator [Mycolicibacterium sphagni]